MGSLFRDAKSALPDPRRLRIDFTSDILFTLFKSIKNFRGRLPSSYLALDDFKVYILSPGLSAKEFLSFAKLVFGLFHGSWTASPSPGSATDVIFWTRERLNGILIVQLYKCPFQSIDESPEEAHRSHMAQIDEDFNVFCETRLDITERKQALMCLLRGNVRLTPGRHHSQEARLARVKQLKSLRRAMAREPEPFQRFLEPFITELTRVFLIETRRAFSEKRDFYFLKDSFETRMRFVRCDAVWRSVFGPQGVRQLDDTRAILGNADRLDLGNFRNLVRLRHFYQYLHALMRLEKDPKLTEKFDQRFLMEKGRFPKKNKSAKHSQSNSEC